MLQALRQMLGAATTALGIMRADRFLPLGRWGQDLLQLGKAVLLLVIGQPRLDPLTGHGPFHEDGLALLARDTDAMQIQAVDGQLQGRRGFGFGLGLEKLGHSAWCLGMAMS